jgi:hypothetical protein
MGENCLGRRGHKLSSERADAIGIGAGPAIIDTKIATLAPAALLEPFPQSRHSAPRLRVGLGTTHQRADPAHAPVLLRPRGERPGRSTAKQRD